MDPPSFDLLTDMPELDLARLEALQQVNRYDAIFMDSITTLLGMCGDGPKMTDVEFGAAIYKLNKWADEANVLVVMTCHLRKQARDATNNNVRIGDCMALAVRHGLPVMCGLFGELTTTTPATTPT